ncbi:hypothetical protein C2U27_20370 [Bacillus aerophilus]|nr:hypothetical protein [Bacillus aerophilus]
MNLDGIELPDDLTWDDEWSWTPHGETAEHSLTGNLIVQVSEPMQAGRPITLKGANDRAWVTRATLEQLRAALSNTSMTLELWDGRTFTVGWRHGDTPIEAQEYIGTGWFHSLTLRLREV